ncbi:MAG: hypothetical protein AAFQ12_08830 [Pseudomonadota bacterium]
MNFTLPSAAAIVTFDIFDTLVHRRCKAPVDVFEITRLRAIEGPFGIIAHDVIGDFTQSRILAEAQAREARTTNHGGEGEITFDEIYDRWQEQTQANDALTEWLKTCELETETAMLFAAPEGLRLFQDARAKGAKIAFLSDMYLPSEWLRDLLIRLGFDGADSCPLYVSGEVRLSKHSGALYDHVSQAEGWSLDENWLHFGDNQRSDIDKAKEAGLSTHFVTWGYVENKLTQRDTSLQANTVASLIGALDLPQAEKYLPQDPLERVGYTIWGPMLFGFTCWIAAQLRQRDITRAVFVARDGWLPMQLFQTLQQHAGLETIETRYFYMSRKTGYLTGVRDWWPERAWQYMFGKTSKSAARCLSAAGLDANKYRGTLQAFGIDQIDHPLPERERYRVFEALNALYADVLRSSRDKRLAFEGYYKSTLTGQDRIALIDIGWIGNIQRCFVHSMSDVTTRDKVEGFYIGLHENDIWPNVKLGMKMQGWLNSGVRYQEHYHALPAGGVELMEFILTADHGSTINLTHEDGAIVPVLEEQGADELEHQRLALRAQKGLTKFFEDNLYLLDLLSPEMLSSADWADPFLRLVTAPKDDEIELLAGISHSDSPGSNAERLKLARKLPLKHRFRPKYRRRARREAFWKAAFDRLNRVRVG